MSVEDVIRQDYEKRIQELEMEVRFLRAAMEAVDHIIYYKQIYRNGEPTLDLDVMRKHMWESYKRAVGAKSTPWRASPGEKPRKRK